MRKAYLVPTFHHDIAYLRPEKDYTAGCMQIIDEAIHILQDNPEYCFFIEQAWLLEEYWDARPEKREALKELAKEGRLTIEPGLYAVPDMNMPDGESLYMHATVGKKIARDMLGVNPRVCMIADCWGHHAQIPQIFSQCGYDYYVFSRCMRPDVDRQNFIWRGIDGSTIRAHWMSTHYDGVGFPSSGELENADELEWSDASEKGIQNLMDRNREKCGDDVQYLPVGGDMRHPSAAAPQIVKNLNARGKLPELVFAAPANALDAVDWEKSIVANGEFESSMQGTFSTNIWIKQKGRKYAGEIYALEALSAALRAHKDFTLPWKLHLKNQFHDIICGTICNGAYRDVDADFRALGHLLTQIRRDLTTGAGDRAYFNALPFERSIRTEKGLLMIPTLGFASAADALQPETIETPTLPCAFENEFYLAKIDKNGYLTSLVERKSGCELIHAQVDGRPVPFGALTMQLDNGDNWWSLSTPHLNRKTQGYVMNRPDPLFQESINTFMPTIERAEVVRADADELVIRQTGCVRYWIVKVSFTTTITLSKSVREIAYHTEFTCESKNLRIRAAFPVENLPERRRQIPYAIAPFGDSEQTTQMFMDAQNGQAGLAVLNAGTPAGNIDDGVMMLTLFRSVAMEYKCDSDLSYNIGRAFAFDYAVCPHAAGEDEALWQAALCLNTPVISCCMPEASALPQLQGALASCIRETADGLFVRLYNPANEARMCCLTLSTGCTQAMLTDGLGQAGEAVSVENGQVKLKLNAYGVQGILCR